MVQLYYKVVFKEIVLRSVLWILTTSTGSSRINKMILRARSDRLFSDSQMSQLKLWAVLHCFQVECENAPDLLSQRDRHHNTKFFQS
ncbi:MAG: hypothetical protein ACRC2S_10280 [Waterburya sp.]